MRTDDIGYHHKHDSSFCNDRPAGSGDWLLLLLHTPAIFTFDQVEMPVRENSFVLYTPQFPQHYRAADTAYMDDWLHFEPDTQEKALIARLGIPQNQPVYVKTLDGLSDLVLRMSFEHYSAHPNRKETVDLYFRILLYKLQELLTAPYADQVITPGPYLDKLMWLRVSVFRWPEQHWSASVFAKELRLSVSRFQHLYSTTFGTTMLQDITSGRIQRACTLLANTTLSVGEIAEQCGYASTSHFIKLFRKLMGCAPMGYRKSVQQQKTPPHGLNHERGVSV